MSSAPDAPPRPDLAHAATPRTERTDAPPARQTGGDAVRPAPRSVGDLFVSFTILALQGFGGVLPVIQREMVERKRWMTQDEFIEDWAVAQIMPGPNVVNLAMMVGGRHFGLPGAMAALAGLLAVPMVVVLLLAVLHASFADSPAVAGALRGMAAVSAGLIAAVGLKLSAALARSPIPLPWCAAIGALGFVLVAWLRWPLFFVLLGLGSLGCIIAYRKLA
jgi:chromate transporter